MTLPEMKNRRRIRLLTIWWTLLTNAFMGGVWGAPPLGTDGSVTLVEDTPYAFSAADFGFSDPNDTPAHVFTRVKVTTAPTAGVLSFDGNVVNAGNFVSMLPVGGVAWTERDQARAWTGVASSADGSKLVASVSGGFLYTSTDFGVTWTQRASVRNWVSVTSSADGMKLAAAEIGGLIYTSTDAGVTWTSRASNLPWTDIASSSNGNVLVASAIGTGIYVSVDSGQTWGVRATSNNWRCVASNAGGNVLVGGIDNGVIQVSVNSGTNWTTRTAAGFWTGVACSANGITIAATKPGEIHVSTNGGSSWAVWTGNQDFKSIAMSSDGTRMVAVADGGWIYTSYDSGATWTKRDSLRTWRRAATSSDGSRMVAVANQGNIYNSDPTSIPVIYTPQSNANGVAAASFTFQVEDSGALGSNLDVAAKTMTLNVTGVNDAPVVLNAIPNANGLPGVPLTYQFPADSFSEPDSGDTLTYTASLSDGSPLPSWLTFDGVTRTFSGTPSAGDVGILSLKVTATDSSPEALIATDTFQLVIGVIVPSGTDGSVSTLEDTNHVFAPADFGFTEGSPSLANNFIRVKISSLPAVGTLTSFGQPVIVGDEIDVQSFVGGQWVRRQSGNFFSSVAISADGGQIAATRISGKIFISMDSGATWAEKHSNQNWSSVANSATGQYLAATAIGGQIYTSSDSGNTWTARDSSRNWNSVAMSANGSRAVATVSSGQIYVSSDQGVTWSARATNQFWNDVACSADGLKMVAVALGDRIFLSTDGGETWTGSGPIQDWTSVCSSADGTKLAATASNGMIYISDNSGLSWNPRATNQEWTSIQCSADGETILASVDHGRIYVSNDAGFSWAARAQNRNWSAVAISADGSLFAGAVGNVTQIGEESLGGVHTSVLTPMDLVFAPALNASGLPYASFTFQVIDDGFVGFNLDPVPNLMTINVTAQNDAPTVVTPLPDRVAPKLELFNVPLPENTFNDADPGTIFTYTATLTNGNPLPAWLSISPTTGTLSGTPALNDAGSFDVRITASDNGSPPLSVSDIFKLIVSTDPPEGADAVITIDEDQTYQFSAADFAFSDPKDSPPNNFVGVTLTTVPAVGSLTLDGGVVPAGYQFRFPSVLARNTWTGRGPTKKWKSIASSSNGEKLVAVEGGSVSGSMYTSSDGGETWTLRDSVRTWQGVASSADGTTLVAVASAGGSVHVSTDSGVTWVQRGNTSPYSGVTCSADGTKMATCSNSGNIYTSQNAGVTWTSRTVSRAWQSISSSADGTILVASTATNVYVSVDSGVTWIERPPNGNLRVVSLSADGTKLAGIVSTNIRISSDLGLTWQSTGPALQWTGIASSSDGAKLVAVATSNGKIYISTDSGKTWLPRESSRSWSCVASSADGNKLVAGVTDGLIYKSTATNQVLTFTPAFNGTGAAYASLTYQVQDDGAYGGTLDPTPNTITFNLNSINDPPRPNATASANLVATKNALFTFTYPTFTFTDGDVGSVLTYSATQADGSPLPSWLNLDGATRTLSGTPTESGLWMIKLTATDDAVPPLSGSATFAFSVPGSTPEGTDGVVTLDEDKSYTLGPANFGFTDPNEIPANRLSRIQIITVPSVGELKLNGTPVTAGTLINLNPGTAWTARGGVKSWTQVKSSADGTRLAAIGDGRIYTSADSGVTWTARESVRTWTSLAMSADGTKLVASVDGGKIYTSADSGVTWTAGTLDLPWQRVASSADGVRLFAGAGYRATAVPPTFGSPLYISTNSGLSWSASGETESWEDLAVSANGSRIAAVLGQVEMVTSQRMNGNFKASSTAGASWMRRSEALNWTAVACSADGSKVVAVKRTGRIFTSTDYGQTWTARETSRNWNAVASSADGSTLVATVSSGSIYLSVDSGVTWEPRDSSRNWTCVTVSADGLKFAAGTSNSQIFVYQIPALVYTPPANEHGLPLASMTFQLEDDGLAGATLDPTPNTLTFEVNSINDAPAVDNAIPTQLAPLGQAFAYQIPATAIVDPDPSDVLLFTASNADGSPLPSWLTFDQLTRTFSGTPQATDQRITEIKLDVVDNGEPQLSVSTFFKIIIPTNSPTGIDSVVTALEDSSYTFSSSDFGFSDASDALPNALSRVTLTSAPSQGTLYLDGVAVVPGNVLSVSDPLAQAAWTPRDSNRNWRAITSCSDGVKLAAVVNGGFIYTSNDSGATWTQREQSRNWYSIDCSSDGTKLVASVYGGQMYTSTDSGVTWVPRASTKIWRSVASSANGTKLIACAYGDQLYTSTDSGVTWTPREAVRNWYAVASSDDGTKLVAVVDGGQIYTSTDSGVTWTARESVRDWRSVASSADGTRLVASIYNGLLYTSMNSGASWTPQDTVRGWYHVASSADGKRLSAVIASGTLLVSTDYGVTWTPRDSNRSWYAIASSANGEKLTAIVSNGRIYTSVASMQSLVYTAPANISGTPYATFSYQVQDDGLVNTIDLTPNTMNINVAPVNDAPSLNSIAGRGLVSLTAGQQSVPLSGIAPGGGEIQGMVVTATSSNPLIIPHPTVNYVSPSNVGTLYFTPSGNAGGDVVITVRVQDSGGTANGGVDTVTKTFGVSVQTPYQAWAASNGISPIPSANGGSNLLNFAFGLSANTGAKGAVAVSNTLITERGGPTVMSPNPPELNAVFARRKNSGLTYTVQFTNNLTNWENSVTIPTVLAEDGVIEACSIPFPNLLNSGLKPKYFRVLITH